MLTLASRSFARLWCARTPGVRVCCCVVFFGACGLWPAWADGHDTAGVWPAHVLDEVEIVGHAEDSTGERHSASQGRIAASALMARPLLRPADVLEQVPGMVVTQHSGDGKANQYFLRGINLDHGSDFASTVNGVPVNLPSHAHGQGYSDLNFLMPELVQSASYRKGPYQARDGDFSAAGAADWVYRTQLDRPFSDLTLGQRGYARAIAAASQNLTHGQTLLGAVERLNNDGPWTVAEGLRKTNTLLTLSDGSAAHGWSTSWQNYRAHWTATDQVPQRLLNAGIYQGQGFGLYDSVDPSDGGSTARSSLSGEWHQRQPDSATFVNAYVLRYDMDLYANFSYAMRSASGDQFNQRDHRQVWGAAASHAWWVDVDTPHAMVNTLGLQLRQDDVDLGLYDSAQRVVGSAVRIDQVAQRMWGVYGESDMRWHPQLRTIWGLRWDQYTARVNSVLLPDNSGMQRSQQRSPKLSVVLGPWGQSEFFVNAGHGFHSNDARGTTATIDPRSGSAITPVPGLVRARGQEVGMRTQAVPTLQTTVALWRLDFDSELHYLGDTGGTEAGRPSHRVGLEWTQHWMPSATWELDTNIAWTRPRYSDGPAAQAYIPNAVRRVAQLAATARRMGPWTASMGWRYIGPAALSDDNGVQSHASITSNLRLTRVVDAQLRVSVDVLNLSNRRHDDIAYFYASRLPGEATAVNDVHVHPGEPRSLRLNLHYQH